MDGIILHGKMVVFGDMLTVGGKKIIMDDALPRDDGRVVLTFHQYHGNTTYQSDHVKADAWLKKVHIYETFPYPHGEQYDL